MLLFDFVLLFAESGVLIALGAAQGSARNFGLLAIGLLLIDIVWNVVGEILRKREWSPQWAKINAPAVVACGIIMVLPATAALLAVGALARTVVDYRADLDWYLGDVPDGTPV